MDENQLAKLVFAICQKSITITKGKWFSISDTLYLFNLSIWVIKVKINSFGVFMTKADVTDSIC